MVENQKTKQVEWPTISFTIPREREGGREEERERERE